MMRFGLFRFARIDYAVPLQRLCKILHQGSLFQLPRLSKKVPEVLLDDGILYPLVSLSSGEGSQDSGTVEYQVIVESEAGRVALPADQTYGIVSEVKGQLSVTEKGSVAGVVSQFTYQDRSFQILDIDVLAIGLTQ